MKILVLSSLAYSLVNFRGRLIEAMLQAGHQVVACAPDDDADVRTWLETRGAGFRITPMARTGRNPAADLLLLWRYLQVIRHERPDVVLAYTQKPIIYGGLATRLFRKPRFHALMSGLGYVFSPAAESRWLLRAIVTRLYRTAVAKARTIFVFNADDVRVLTSQKIGATSSQVIQVPGSGVDLAHFRHEPLPQGPMVFLMIARLMRDKGVLEYGEAARRLKARYPDAVFRLLGRLETENPTAISEAELGAWVSDRTIEYFPETRDVRPLLAGSTVFVLPSFYREGLPRTLLEAMATGRALITSDLPGCRETVRPGQNGILVPPQDTDALSEAMERFLRDPALAASYGAASRSFAEEHFDVELVNRQLLRAMELDTPVPSRGEAPQGTVSWSAG
jgi:glycosyltransferase involved in cell wall biosynthesis